MPMHRRLAPVTARPRQENLWQRVPAKQRANVDTLSAGARTRNHHLPPSVGRSAARRIPPRLDATGWAGRTGGIRNGPGRSGAAGDRPATAHAFPSRSARASRSDPVAAQASRIGVAWLWLGCHPACPGPVPRKGPDRARPVPPPLGRRQRETCRVSAQHTKNPVSLVFFLSHSISRSQR